MKIISFTSLLPLFCYFRWFPVKSMILFQSVFSSTNGDEELSGMVLLCIVSHRVVKLETIVDVFSLQSL